MAGAVEASMRTIDLDEIRRDAAKVIREAMESDEVVQIVERDAPVAYLFSAQQYVQLEAELSRLRRAAEQRDVAEVQAEVQRVGLPAYEDPSAMAAEPGLPPAEATEPESTPRS